jgi:hypothetical protein
VLQKGDNILTESCLQGKVPCPLVNVRPQVHKEDPVGNRGQDFMKIRTICRTITGKYHGYTPRQSVVMNGTVSEQLKEIGLDLAITQVRIIQK